MADSKRASEMDLTRAKEQLSETSEKLSEAVERFERALLRSPSRPKRRTDWHKVFEVLGSVAGAVEHAVRDKPPIAVGVIDTSGETVRVSAQRRRRGE